VASAAGGAAPNFAVLASARAVQGLFAALLAPSALSLLATTFTDARQRGKAFAVFGAIAGGGGAVGLLLGGVLTSCVSWRWCLCVNLIFAAVAGIGGLILLSNPCPRRPPEDRRPRGRAGVHRPVRHRLRLLPGSDRLVGESVTLVRLALGVVLLAAFIQVQRRVAHPLLPLRVGRVVA
jgi:MFS family permease